MSFLCFLKTLCSQAHRHIPKGNMPGTQHPSQMLPHHPFYCPIEQVYAEMPGEKHQAQRSEAGRAGLALGSPLGPAAKPPCQRQPSHLRHGTAPASSTACSPQNRSSAGLIVCIRKGISIWKQKKALELQDHYASYFPSLSLAQPLSSLLSFLIQEYICFFTNIYIYVYLYIS